MLGLISNKYVFLSNFPLLFPSFNFYFKLVSAHVAAQLSCVFVECKTLFKDGCWPLFHCTHRYGIHIMQTCVVLNNNYSRFTKHSVVKKIRDQGGSFTSSRQKKFAKAWID